MAETKYNQARLIPFILMSLVTLVFLFWAMRQCDSGEENFAMIAEEKARQTYLDSIRRIEGQAARQAEIDKEAEARAQALLRARTQPLPGDSAITPLASQVIVEKVTPLYSTINGLNVRSGPSLKNGVLARLPLYAEVTFAGKVTDSLYSIDLGEITPTAPWVQVKLPDGKLGWAYGAGLSYYKFELKGVYTD